MRSCDEFQELISRKLDEDLTADEAHDLEKHVQSCPDCAAVYQAFSSLSESLADELEEVPEGLHETVMADLRRKDLNKQKRPARRWPALLAAAACLTLILLSVGRLPALSAGGSAPAPEIAPAANDASYAILHETAEEDALAELETITEEAPDEEPSEAYDGYMNAKMEVLSLAEGEESERFAALLTQSPASFSPENADRLWDVSYYDGTERKELLLFFRGEEAAYVLSSGEERPCLLSVSPAEFEGIFADKNMNNSKKQT